MGFHNGFCLSWVFGMLYRGDCTDATWSKASGCAVECLSGQSSRISITWITTLTISHTGIDRISPCGDGTVCCGYAPDAAECCLQGKGFAWNTSAVLNYGDSGAESSVTTLSSAMTASGTVTTALVTDTMSSTVRPYTL